MLQWVLNLALMQWNRKPNFFRTVVILTAFILISVVLGCMYPEAELAEAGGSGKTIPRSAVMARLRYAVLANMQECPEHESTALYTLEEVLAREVKYSYYTKESAERCQLMLLSAPCMGSRINETDYQTKYYLYIFRFCGLKKVSD